MTNWLTDRPRTVRFLGDNPIVAVDIGARGGFDEALASLAPFVDMVGFEPEPAEAHALRSSSAGPWRSLTVLEYAVGGAVEPALLYLPDTPESASLLPHNSIMADWFGTDSMHRSRRTLEVKTTTLDALAESGTLTVAHYVKIDVEGAELAILEAGRTLLETALCLKIEASFLEQRLRQPLLWEVARALASSGFLVVDLLDIQYLRRHRQPAHPLAGRGFLPWSRGVIAQADILAFRDFRRVEDAATFARLVFVAAAQGYADLAAIMIDSRRDLARAAATEHGLDLMQDVRAASRAGAKTQPWRALTRHAKWIVPLIRSVGGGIPGAATDGPARAPWGIGPVRPGTDGTDQP